MDEKPEVVLIDDFLGQIYNEVNRNNCSDLITLINFIQMKRNKIIILNSRIGILKNVLTSNEKFKVQLDSLQIPNINISDLRDLDKARILYNYLTIKIADNCYLQEIIKDKFYWEIIRHENYNPRLIERITDKGFYENISPKDYPSRIMLVLNNPSQIWKEEFEHHIMREDQLLLTSLFSLTNYSVEEEYLKQVFIYRAKLENIDFTMSNKYEDAMTRMIDSYVKIDISYNRKMVSMINNSLNDYFDSFYKSNPNGLNSLLESCNYTEQLIKLSNWNLMNQCNNERVIQICLSSRIDDFRFIQYPPYFLKILTIFQKEHISEEEYCRSVEILFSIATLKPFVDCLEKGFNRLICGDKLLFNKYVYIPIKKNIPSLKNLLNNISQSASETLVEMFLYCDEDFLNEHYEEINRYVNDAYYDDLCESFSQELYECMDDIIKDCANDAMDVDEIVSCVEDELIYKGHIYREKYNKRYNPDYISIEFYEQNIETIVNELDCYGCVSQYLNSHDIKQPKQYSICDDENYLGKIDKLFTYVTKVE